MTQLQKDIIQKLLLGYNIYGNSKYGFRLRSPEHHVCMKFGYKTFFKIRDLLRRQGSIFFINKNKVRQLHGKTFAKTQYKKISKKSSAAAAEKFFRKIFLVIKNKILCTTKSEILFLGKLKPRIQNLNVHAVCADALKQMHAFTRSMEIVGGLNLTYAATAITGQAKEDFILN